MTCRWAGRNQPRLLTGHHKPDCDDDACSGCQPCPDDHCPKCWRTHSTGTCTGCVAQGHDDLTAIVADYANLPTEALLGAAATSGVIPGGEATVALGPCSPGTASLWDAHFADDTRIGDWHPLLTLATWATVWRDWFGTPAPTTRATVASEAAYLGRILHLAAATQPRDDEWPPELLDMLADLGTLRARLEDVTHDGERVDHGAPCSVCDATLVARYDDRDSRNLGGRRDLWECPRCKRTYSPAEYWLAVRARLAQASA